LEWGSGGGPVADAELSEVFGREWRRAGVEEHFYAAEGFACERGMDKLVLFGLGKGGAVNGEWRGAAIRRPNIVQIGISCRNPTEGYTERYSYRTGRNHPRLAGIHAEA